MNKEGEKVAQSFRRLGEWAPSVATTLVDRIMISAIIFDLDGLLVDSEPCWDRVRQQIAAEYGQT